jgi:hypothetical protein
MLEPALGARDALQLEGLQLPGPPGDGHQPAQPHRAPVEPHRAPVEPPGGISAGHGGSTTGAAVTATP